MQCGEDVVDSQPTRSTHVQHQRKSVPVVTRQRAMLHALLRAPAPTADVRHPGERRRVAGRAELPSVRRDVSEGRVSDDVRTSHSPTGAINNNA